MYVRPETAADRAGIHSLTSKAFAEAKVSSGKEADIIDALRKDGDLALSLVATDRGKLVGHVAFSAVRIGDIKDGWFGLGPVSVDPWRQKRGIGKGLIGRGLSLMSARGAAGIVLVGDPHYYQRFGFSSGGLTFAGLDPQFVQFLHWTGPKPQGEIAYAPGFSV